MVRLLLCLTLILVSSLMEASEPARLKVALALHGGAGTEPDNMTAAERELFGRHAAYYREHAKTS